jgi:flagellar hook-basal body complex protein FliE
MSTINEVSSVPLAPAAPAERPTAGTESFADVLGSALSSVEQLQKSADSNATSLAEGAGNLHETSIALAKAEIGMHLMTQVRNKVVSAYEDILKMAI